MAVKIKKLMLYLFGCMVIGFGISCYLNSGMGSASFTILTQGLSMKTGLTVGLCNQMIFSAIAVLLLFFDKKMLKIGVLINIIGVGWFIDIFTLIFPQSGNLFVRIMVMLVGIVAYAVGVSLTIVADIGAGPVDSLMQLLKKRTNLDVAVVRVIMDIVVLILGVLMGAVFGIGSILGSLCTGSILKHSLNFFQKTIKINSKVVG